MLYPLTFKDWSESSPADLTKNVYISTTEADVFQGTFVNFGDCNEYIGRIVDVKRFEQLRSNEKEFAARECKFNPDRLSIFCKINIFSKFAVVQNRPTSYAFMPPPSEDRNPNGEPLELYQSKQYVWILDSRLNRVAFVFHKDDVMCGEYEGDFMENFYTFKYRQVESAKDSPEEILCKEILPFPSMYDIFQDKYCIDCYALKVWESIVNVRVGLLSMLCRAGKSQGTRNQRSIHSTSEFWSYLKNNLKDIPIKKITKNVKVLKLKYGMIYFSVRQAAEFEELTFDTLPAIDQLRRLIGGCCVGYGVRKPRPRYDATEAVTHIHMGDSVNLVDCWNNDLDVPLDEAFPNWKHQRDRKQIKLAFNRKQKEVRLHVSYSLVVLTEESIVSSLLDRVGVQIRKRGASEMQKASYSSMIELDDLFAYPFDLEKKDDPGNAEPTKPSFIYKVVEVDDEKGIVRAMKYWHIHPDGHGTKYAPSDEYIDEFDDPAQVLQAINHMSKNELE